MVKLELVLEPDEADLILRAIERAREVHAHPAELLETEAPSAPAVAAIDACIISGPPSLMKGPRVSERNG
jgi:hypothetical protein